MIAIETPVLCLLDVCLVCAAMCSMLHHAPFPRVFLSNLGVSEWEPFLSVVFTVWVPRVVVSTFSQSDSLGRKGDGQPLGICPFLSRPSPPLHFIAMLHVCECGSLGWAWPNCPLLSASLCWCCIITGSCVESDDVCYVVMCTHRPHWTQPQISGG